jgi:preprotein translocase subunit YajC
MITPAFAQAGAPAAGGELVMQLAPFILIFIIMWFLIIRPQQKRARAHLEMIKAIRRGDTVVTAAGFVGKVTKVIDDNEVEVEIADNVRVRTVRATISDVRSKSEPANTNTK